MRKRTRRRPEVFLALAILLAGCATTLPPAPKVDLLQPAAASRSVAVLPDPYAQNFELADHLATGLREECRQHGFDVKPDETSADLVIIPRAIAPAAAPASAAPTRVAWRRPRLFDSSRDSLSGTAQLRVSTASAASDSPPLVLVVSAYRQKDWFDPQFIDAPMPKVWRIVAAAPRREGRESEQLPELLAAVGRGLDQVAPRD